MIAKPSRHKEPFRRVTRMYCQHEKLRDHRAFMLEGKQMCNELADVVRGKVAAVFGRCPGLIPLRTVLRYVGVVVLLLVATSIVGFPGIKTWWITADLSEYAQAIRHADCSLESKEHILDRTEALEDCMRHGGSIGLPRWWRCNRAVRDLLELGLNNDNIALLERELRRVEREIMEQQTGGPLR
jgi:hypothetical protein